MTFKEWPLICPTCGTHTKEMAWDYQLPLSCGTCHGPLALDYGTKQQSAGIATDDIPGGMEIKHGICNPDGSPKRYYSKTEMKRAANERGYTIAGDTPKPYKVAWSGRQKRTDGV